MPTANPELIQKKIRSILSRNFPTQKKGKHGKGKKLCGIQFFIGNELK